MKIADQVEKARSLLPIETFERIMSPPGRLLLKLTELRAAVDALESHKLPNAVLQSPAQGTPAPLTMMKDAFLKLSGLERHRFLDAGGKVLVPSMTRSAWEKLSAREKMDFCRAGKLID